MKRKIKTAKLITDFLGLSIGLVSCFFMLIMTISFINYGGIIFYENNITISIIELIAALFATIYFSYRIIKMLTKKELENYIKKV